MRVLGVDPGLTRCGIGVVQGRRGGRLQMVAVGVIRTPRSDDPAERLGALAAEMEEWFSRHEPEAVAVERVFAKSNIKGIMGTAQASAVPMLAAARRGLPVALHTPTEVKAAVSGHGGADKAQVTGMVTRILGLDAPPRPADAADALALAICHIWRGGALAQLEGAVSGQNRLEQAVAAHRVDQARARRRWDEAAAAARAHQRTTAEGLRGAGA